MARLWGDPKSVPSRAEDFWPLPGDDVPGIDEYALIQAQKEYFAQRAAFAGKTE
jgi:hypothetical protein